MKIKGVIFDVDGVLLDTMPVWTNAGAKYLETLGIEAEANLGAKLFAMTVDMGAVYLKEEYKMSQSLDEIIRGINGVVEDYYYYHADFKPGARKLLKSLSDAEIPMTIASSTGRKYIAAAMERLDVMHCFKEILSCVEMTTSKSEPEIFYEAMRIMGTKPCETWLFEDGLYSVKTAAAAGINTVGVFDAVSAGEQKELAATADIYVTSLEDFQLI